MTVREAGPADAAAVAAAFLAARAGMGYLPRLHTDEETRAYLRDVVLATARVWVAEVGGAGVVGFAAVTGGDRLDHLFVHPDHQGGGAGTALLTTVQRLHPGGLVLWVFAANPRAAALYERHGFVVERRTDGADNEENLPDVLYRWGGSG